MKPLLRTFHCLHLQPRCRLSVRVGRIQRRSGKQRVKQIMGHEAGGEERGDKRRGFPNNWMWWSHGMPQLGKLHTERISLGTGMEAEQKRDKNMGIENGRNF